MKNRILIKTLAVAMTAAFLAGCSDKPAGESDTGIEIPAATESSVTETESSAVVTETQAEKDITDVAVAYGMTKVTDWQEMNNLWGGGFDSASVYYVSKDSNEAMSMYSSLFNQDAKSVPDVRADELVMCLDKVMSESDGRSTTTQIYKITLADAASAQGLYDSFSQMKDSYKSSTGTACGYTYTIGFFESANGCVAVGTFMKDNVVIRMLSIGDVEAADKCLSFFCGELGFESPLTLK